MFGLDSFLENSIFGMIIDQDNKDLESYDESIVTSVIETGPGCKEGSCKEDSILQDDDFDDDLEDFNWDDDDDFDEDITDDIENTKIYDEFDSDYRTYF